MTKLSTIMAAAIAATSIFSGAANAQDAEVAAFEPVVNGEVVLDRINLASATVPEARSAISYFSYAFSRFARAASAQDLTQSHRLNGTSADENWVARVNARAGLEKCEWALASTQFPEKIGPINWGPQHAVSKQFSTVMEIAQEICFPAIEDARQEGLDLSGYNGREGERVDSSVLEKAFENFDQYTAQYDLLRGVNFQRSTASPSPGV